MLPLQGAVFFLHTYSQGVAIGLVYIAPSGRTLVFSIMLPRPERAKFVSPEHRSGVNDDKNNRAP